MKRDFKFIPIFVLSWFLLSRFVDLAAMPLFADEAYAILRARELHLGFPVLGMIKNTTQPIFIWAISLAQFLPLSLVITARLISVTAGLVTVFGLGKIASILMGKKAFWWAAAMAAILPFSVFQDRVALFESLTNMWMVLAIMSPTLFMPLGILTKQTAWLILPLVLFLHKGNKKKIFWILLLSITIPVSVWTIAFGGWNRFLEVMLTTSASPLSFKVGFGGNIWRVKLWMLSYLTWPIILAAAIGFFYEVIGSVRKRLITPLAFMGMWVLAVILFESLTARIFYPRYLYPIVIGVVLLATRSCMLLADFLRNKAAMVILIGLAVYIPLRTDTQIIFKPLDAPLALEDRFQYYEDFTSGIGAGEIANEVSEIFYQTGLPLSVYLEDDNAFLVTILDKKELKGAKIEVADWLKDPLVIIPDEVLREKGESLFIRNRHPDIPGDWPVELILEVPKTNSRSVYLYRIIK